MPPALPPIPQESWEQHNAEAFQRSTQEGLASIAGARRLQEAADESAAADFTRRARTQLDATLAPHRDAQRAVSFAQQAQEQVRSLLSTVPSASPGRPAGGAASGLGRVYQDARAAGLDEEGARAAVAVAATEGGMTGAVGDLDHNPLGAAGTFQLNFGGGQGNEYARSRGITDQQARDELARDPHAGNRYALGGYLGAAIREGQARGLSGPALAEYAQRYGQRSVAPERAASNYAAAVAGLEGDRPPASGSAPRFGPAARAPGSVSAAGIPDQFGRDQGLTDAEAAAACGPALAVWFASTRGRNPTLKEAVGMARRFGWNEAGGMNGLRNESRLLTEMGVGHRVEPIADERKLAADANSGNPVGISTGFHYFGADAYDPRTATFHVGRSGTNVRGGSEWMSLAQMDRISRERSGVGLNGAIYVDSPRSPTPSVAVQPEGERPPSEFEPPSRFAPTEVVPEVRRPAAYPGVTAPTRPTAPTRDETVSGGPVAGSADLTPFDDRAAFGGPQVQAALRAPDGLDAGPYPGALPPAELTAPVGGSVEPPRPTRRERVRSALEELTDALVGDEADPLAQGKLTTAQGPAGRMREEGPYPGSLPSPGYDPNAGVRLPAEEQEPGLERWSPDVPGMPPFTRLNLPGLPGMALPVAPVPPRPVPPSEEEQERVLRGEPFTPQAAVSELGKFVSQQGGQTSPAGLGDVLIPEEAAGRAVRAAEARGGTGSVLGRGVQAVGDLVGGGGETIGRSLSAVAEQVGDGATGRILRPAAREVVDAYDRLSAGRAPVIRRKAIDVLTAALGREDLRPLLEQTFDAGKRLLSAAKTVRSELSPPQVQEIIATGRAPRSMFGALQDEDAAARAAYASVNGFAYDAKKSAAAAAAGGRRKGERVTLEEAKEFNRTTAQADVGALGSTEYLGREEDAVPRLFALVTEGEPLPNERRGLVYVQWKPGTERVSTAHHHFGLVDAERDYHAGTDPGLKALMQDQPGGTHTLPSGRTISDTPWLVGPAAEDDMRMAALVASMPGEVRERLLAGGLRDPEQLAAVLLRGGMSREQPLKTAAREAGLARTGKQLKEAGLSEDYAYHLAGGVNVNRTESLIVDPSLHNIEAIYIVDRPTGLTEPRTPGVPSSEQAAQQLADAVERATGTRPPVITKTLEPGVGKQIDARLSPGRAEIVRRYTAAGFPDIGVRAPDIAGTIRAGLRAPPAANVAGAVAGGLTGYETAPEGGTPLETAGRVGAFALAGSAGVNAARGALRGGLPGAVRGLELDTGIGRRLGAAAGEGAPARPPRLPVWMRPPEQAAELPAVAGARPGEGLGATVETAGRPGPPRVPTGFGEARAPLPVTDPLAAVERALARPPSPPLGERLRGARDRILRETYDRLYPLKELDQAAGFAPGGGAHALAQVFSGAVAAGEDVVEREAMSQIKRLRPSLVDDLERYMVLRSAEDAVKNTPGTRLPGGIDGPGGVLRGLAALRAKLGEESFGLVEDVAKNLYRVNDENRLGPLRAEGIIDQARLRDTRNANPHYLPFDRYEYSSDDPSHLLPRVGRTVGSQPGVDLGKRTAAGSSKALDEPLARWLADLIDTQVQVARNRTARRVVEGLHAWGERTGQTLVRVADEAEAARLGLTTTTQDLAPISFFDPAEPGVKKIAQVPKLLAEIARGAEAQPTNAYFRIGRALAAPLRFGATVGSLGFMPVNVMRDLQSLLAKEGRRAITDGYYLRGLKAALARNTDFSEAARAGALQSGLLESRRTRDVLARARQQLPNTLSVSSPKDAALLLPRLIGRAGKTVLRGNEILEQAPRIATYLKARAEGDPALAAAIRGRNVTVDFSKSGNAVQMLNQLVPFLNARVQGAANTLALFKTNPAQATLRLGAPLTMASTAVFLWNQRFETADQIPDYEWDRSWPIIVGEGYQEPDPRYPDRPSEKFPIVARLPKGDLAAAVTAAPEAMLRIAFAQGDRSVAEHFLQAGRAMTQGLSPIDPSESGLLGLAMPPIAATGSALAANYDPYRERPIVPQGETDRPPEEQYGPETGRTAVLLGQRFGVSPRMIDYAIRSYTGGAGAQAEWVTDLALGALGYDPAVPGEAFARPLSTVEQIARVPGVSRFLGVRGNEAQRIGAERFDQAVTETQRAFYQLPDVRPLGLSFDPVEPSIGRVALTPAQRVAYQRAAFEYARDALEVVQQQPSYEDAEPADRRRRARAAIARGRAQAAAEVLREMDPAERAERTRAG